MNFSNRICFQLAAAIVVTTAAPVKSQEVSVELETIEIDTTPQTVAGIVVDDAGQPIAGARVEACTPVVGFYSSFSSPSGGDPFVPPRFDTTDAEGRFRISEVPLGGATEVQLRLGARHRHVNDANYPLKQELRIRMRGSGKPGVTQGRAIDAATGLPILPVAKVRVMRRHTATVHEFSAEDGRFTLPGEVTLGNESMIYVYAKGYAAAASKVKAVQAGSNTFHDIELTARPPLRGKLVDAQTGKPIAGAALLYGVADEARYFQWSDFEKHADGYHSLELVQHERTNHAGEFWFAEANDGPPGTLFVNAAPYQRFVLRPENRELDAATGEIVVRLPRESVFLGTVLRDEKPLANVGVSVHLPREEGVMEQWHGGTRTDAEGRYRLGGLPPGDYLLSAGPYGRKATLKEAEVVALNFGDDLGPNRIWGVSTPGARISIHPRFDWDYTRIETRADAEGRYECVGLKPGFYTASVWAGRRAGGFSHDYKVPGFIVERDGQRVDLLPEETKPASVGEARK